MLGFLLEDPGREALRSDQGKQSQQPLQNIELKSDFQAPLQVYRLAATLLRDSKGCGREIGTGANESGVQKVQLFQD